MPNSGYHGFKGKFIPAIGNTEWDDFYAENVDKFKAAKEKLKEQNVNHLLMLISNSKCLLIQLL